ncbi:MAG: class I SAM-dependent methyltransferase [Chloroflexi bacterium]|nr:class I SAM-dependent methyltransferase [Chloroflexota bacterium]
MGAGSSFGADADIYDRSRRQLIPCFDDFYGMAVKGAPQDREARLRVLDLGAGTGLLSAFFADAFPRASFVLTDAAPEMLERAKARFAGDLGRYEFVVNAHEEPLPAGPFDLVISALSIHHLDDEDKRSLFKRVRDALREGGAFINADQVLAPSPGLHARYHAQWMAEARALGVTEGDLAAAMERMTHDRCATLEDQLLWLRSAGYADVDCVYKRGFFAVMCAYT